jgi:signal transduction histidine kinase
MELRGPLTSEQRDDIEKIRRNQHHLLGLLNDILNFSRVEAGVLTLDIQTVDARDLLASLEPLVTPLFREKGVRYEMRGCPMPMPFRGDAERCRQICLNLLTNALKATDPGGCVTIACGHAGSAVAIRVSDSGMGIPPAKLEAIFDPFTQLGRSLSVPALGGVGLGLSISRGLARAMDGDITVESTVGAGSTFTLTLPPA